MGISNGIGPGRGPDGAKGRRITLQFSPGKDVFAGAESRAVDDVPCRRLDALVNQSDAITNFSRQKGDVIYLSGVSGTLRKAACPLRRGEAGSLGDPGATKFVAPGEVVAIRVIRNSGQDLLGSFMLANDDRRGLQERGDAIFFVAGLDGSRSNPFRYGDSSLLWLALLCSDWSWRESESAGGMNLAGSADSAPAVWRRNDRIGAAGFWGFSVQLPRSRTERCICWLPGAIGTSFTVR